MTPSPHRTRQYRVTHIPTGIVTVVEHADNGDYVSVAAEAGLRYPLDAFVAKVSEDREIPLPWGCLPLVLRPRVATT